jgi:flagellar biosynthesis protein FliP
MSLWGWITGADKVGEVVDTGLDVVKTAMNGLDALVYTDEEKAQDNAKNILRNGDMAYKFAKLAQSESGASAVTRRICALIVLTNFTIYAQAALVAACFSRMDIVDNIVKTGIALMVGEMAIAVVISMFGYYAWKKK